MFLEIDRFLRHTGMTRAALSRHALGDHRAVASIMEGRRSLTEYTRLRLSRWMQEHPDGVAPGRPGRPRQS